MQDCGLSSSWPGISFAGGHCLGQVPGQASLIPFGLGQAVCLCLSWS